VTISISTRRRWLECPRAEWFTDIARAVPSNPPARVRMLGTVKHKGLEAAFREAAERPGTADHHNRHGRKMIVFAGVAEAAIGQAIFETDGRLDANDLDECVDQVLAVLDTTYIPRSPWILGVEQEFRVGAIRGVVDLILQTGALSVHLRDWKSGGLTGVVVEEDEQLALYAYWARLKFPWAHKITVGLYSLRRNRELIAEISPERAAVVADRVLGTKLDIDDAIALATQPGANPAEIFLPRQGDHCNACPFRSYCPEWTGPAPLAYAAEEVESTKRYLASRLVPVPSSGTRELA
jgi:hypothetical protein